MQECRAAAPAWPRTMWFRGCMCVPNTRYARDLCLEVPLHAACRRSYSCPRVHAHVSRMPPGLHALCVYTDMVIQVCG